ncbi:sulfite exporter TauE/SafE family protein [Marinoscillum sp.]|uniref:sulfite exporter TauE/SafE family protein n=1 Tax=Marinoscillum sp. TaxID=2024838 RepID=UPI003BACFCA4
MIELFSFQFTYLEFCFFLCVPFLIGMAKTGIHGAGMAAVPLLALVFGGRLSSGIMLPILCIADVFAVAYYNRHANWTHLGKLFPWAAGGVVLGTYIGGMIDDEAFRMIMAVIIFMSLGIMVWREKSTNQHIPQGIWFAALLGVLGGFTTMVGNLAGSVMALYLLSMRLPKNEFIGTAAWFFMIVNLFKIPFHVFAWETITLNSFLLDLTSIPAVALGAFVGITIVKKIPEQYYRWFIIATTALAALMMVL